MAPVLTMQQLYKKYSGFSYCNTSITIGNQDISKVADIEWVSCKIEETVQVKASYACVIIQVGKIVKKLEDMFQIGSQVSIEGGYGKSKSNIFYGFLHSISYKESSTQTVEIEIVAMDVLAMMMLGNHYTQKDQKKVSNIAKDIAANATYKKYTTSMKVPTLHKSNDILLPVYLKSDYEVLYQMANTFHYEVFMANKVLYMGIVEQYSFNNITLEDDLGVFEKTVDVGLHAIAKHVKVVGYNMQTTQISKQQTLSFSKFPATSRLDTIMNNSTLQIVSSQIHDMASLDALLKGHVQAVYDQLSHVSMELIFLPEITCGSKITFTLVSKKLTCYVKKVEHFVIDDAKTRIEGCLI